MEGISCGSEAGSYYHTMWCASQEDQGAAGIESPVLQGLGLKAHRPVYHSTSQVTSYLVPDAGVARPVSFWGLRSWFWGLGFSVGGFGFRGSV